MTTVSSPKYLVSSMEHSIVFDRPNGEHINFCIEHSKAFGPIPVSVVYRSDDPTIPDEHGTEYFGNDTAKRQVHIVVFSEDSYEPIIRQEATLSYQEARLLRDLLNRPEVQAVLDKE